MGNEKILINPNDYRSFCFRGEGRANFVISAKNKLTGVRIVWRFAKARKSGLMTIKARSELVNEYMERIVSPLLEERYLVDMHIVEFDINDVHHLAKIPSLPANEKVEEFEELKNLPSDISFLPVSLFRKDLENGTIVEPEKLTSLQMIDATQLPISLDSSKASTITVEIKPKQGFYQNHFNIGIPHCNNCIMQMEKCGSAHFSQMYDFCPLDLYSGVFSRMKKAINSLFLVPHRNLRIFLDGNLVHSDEKPLDRKLFNSTLFPNRQATADDLSSVLCYALSESESKNMFKVHESSVLGQLLKAQRIDPVGIIGAYSMYDQLEDHLKSILLDKSSLSKIGIEAILNDEMKPNGISDEDWTRIQILRRYFVAATMKDCSIMVSIRMVPSSFKTVQRNIIQLPNGRAFAYSIKVVDLDPKTPKNLINSHGRFLAGVKLIKLQNENNQGNAHSLKPCVEM